MTRCACKGAELSCIIGNIFTELRPPCDMCGGEAVTINGITPTRSNNNFDGGGL